MTKATFTGKGRLSLLLFLTGLLCFAAPKARADQGDPPTRVARISYVDGSVSLQPGGEGDWGAAAKNRPMTIGDKIWADKDSRAELQTGQAAIHLGSMTALSFLNLDENVTQMRLAEGSINFRVRELREGDLYEVDTPNLAFTVKEAGAFRIDVNENGDATKVTVIRGEGQVTAGGETYDVHSGEQGEFRGTEKIDYTILQAPGQDGLDRWASERDLKEDNSESSKYVSRDMPGYSDLDDNGSWRDEPEYGHVWYPNSVPYDWAPYSYGYWNWVGPWGWTWVDYDPWGFAPFHYGRWAFVGSRWGWCPGPFFGPPIYGPAFVGFFGGGFGWGLGFGVGWFPLGFGEPFFPWFHCGFGFRERINVRNTFIRNVNIVHNTNIHNFNFVNAHNPRAVTGASREAFTHGQAINRGAFHVTEASLKGVRVTDKVGFSPTKQSSFGAANTRANVARPSASVQNRSVVARTAPAAGASQSHVRTMNSANLAAGRTGNERGNSAANRPANGSVQHPANNTPNARVGNSNNAAMTPRQRELTQARPPAAMQNGVRSGNGAPNNPASQRAANGTRTWEAQGNTTDRGRSPAGFGSSNKPANEPTQSARANRTDRPPWAGSGSAPNNQGSRSNAPSYNSNRPSNSNPNQGGRSYAPQNAPSNNRSYSSPRSSYPQQRSYSPPARSYSPPPRSYSSPSRSYSAPRSYNYSAPRSYSAPSRSYSGGGGSYRGGGGGSRSGGGSSGGGGSRSGGGGGSHGGGSPHGRH